MAKSKIRTLFLNQNGTGRPVMWTDTVLRGLFGYQDDAQCPRPLQRYPRIREMFTLLRDFHRYLSYVPDWRDASVWFCGPAAFGAAVRHDLASHGLPVDRRFHQELFAMR